MSRQLNIQHSLRTYLEAEINVPVVWIFDGVKLPTTKPFMTIEQLQNNTSILTKQREAVRRIYRFQVGLLAATSSQRAQLQERVSDVFLFDAIPYIDVTKTGAEPAGYLSVENPSVTPIGAEDVSDTTQFHKVYFDVAVDVTFNANTK